MNRRTRIIDQWNGGVEVLLPEDGGPTYQSYHPDRKDADGKLIPRYREELVDADGTVIPLVDV